MIRSLLIALCLPLIAAASVVAEPVKYTFSGVASGRADGSAFSQSSFLVEVLADTDDVVPINLTVSGQDFVIFAVQSQQASFSIDTVGSGMFTTDTLVFVNQTVGTAGFSQGTPTLPPTGQDVFALANGFFASYDLRSSTGLIPDPSPQVPATLEAIESTLGLILFTSLDGPATFQATVVPEPSSLALVGLPALIGVYWGRRRLRNRA
ncbi:PEP-CTERM sorting domain-containing protein [Tautonia sp. JC769]|uniref:PEP-CTERM sorting domain-containing protein n=1 Tax=Tautonia sp. JC769 TaxID=3232135 RepID=UPI003458FFBE